MVSIRRNSKLLLSLFSSIPLDVDVLPVDDVGLLEDDSVGWLDTDEPEDGVVLVVLVTGEG